MVEPVSDPEIFHVALPRRSGSDHVVGPSGLVLTVTPGARTILRPMTCPSVSSCRPAEPNRTSLVPSEVVTRWPIVEAPSVSISMVVSPSVALANCPTEV